MKKLLLLASVGVLCSVSVAAPLPHLCGKRDPANVDVDGVLPPKPCLLPIHPHFQPIFPGFPSLSWDIFQRSISNSSFSL